jgi:hypothetical protein
MKTLIKIIVAFILLTVNSFGKIEFNFLIGQTFPAPNISIIKPDVSFAFNVNLIENKSNYGVKLIYEEYQFTPDGTNIGLLGAGGLIPIYINKKGQFYAIPKITFYTETMDVLFFGLSGSFSLNITGVMSGVFQFSASTDNFKQFYNTFLFGLGFTF